MRLLPDIRFNGYRISLQDPYTINNELILNVRINNSDVIIRTKPLNSIYSIWNEYTFNIYGLNQRVEYVYRNIIRNFEYYDERYVQPNFPSNFNMYLNYVRGQSLNCEDGEYIRQCYQRLIAQRRIATLRSPQEFYSSSENRLFDYSDIRRDFEITCNGANWNEEVIERAFTKKYIHPYNYKPKYVHHKLDTEDSPLLLGAEIEVAENTNENEKDNRESVVKKCIQIMNGSDTDDENLIYSTSDSTVQIELDTMPCSLEYHKTLNYKQMFEYLDKQGYKGHDANCAGLHIHADRKYLGKTELMQQLTIAKILYILEKFNDEICVIARRNNSYSEFVGNGKDESSIVDLYGKYKNKGKRAALNLQHPETIEFRCFRSTLKYETFILTLEFVQDIIDYAKSINIEETEFIQWNDLMDTFSNELKLYYEKRLEKESKKYKADANLSYNWINANGSEYNADALWSQTFQPWNIQPRNGLLNQEVADQILMEYNQSREEYNRLCAEPARTLSVELDNDNETDQMSKEVLKKKIRDLKKRIRNCHFYIEKKKLNDELDKVQKSLKKLKQRNKYIISADINAEE